MQMGEELDKKDKPFVKHLVKKLRSGSKTHAKQADDLEKAMKENVMLTYKSGKGFDAKIGNRSVRNTVSNFKTGVDAVKNIKNEKGIEWCHNAAHYTKRSFLLWRRCLRKHIIKSFVHTNKIVYERRVQFRFKEYRAAFRGSNVRIRR